MQDDAQDVALARYRAVSVSAVAGLICGILSPLWMIDPLFWLVPVPLAGILLSGVAWRRIARSAPALAGRRAALVGLVLATFFAAAAPAHWQVYRWAVRREARAFALEWFDLLAHGQAARAHQWTLHPLYRQPPDDGQLAAYYGDGSSAQEELANFRCRQPIETLLALGRRARVCYDRTASQTHVGTKDLVTQTYAVTYRDEQTGKATTFHAALQMGRLPLKTGQAGWQLMRIEGDIEAAGH